MHDHKRQPFLEGELVAPLVIIVQLRGGDSCGL